MFYVYVLYSNKHDKFYVGHTPDPKKRLHEHNAYETGNKFTAKYQPWKMATYFPVSEDRGKAMIVERFIKKQKSRTFLKKVIDNCQNVDFITQLIKKAIGQSGPDDSGLIRRS